MRPAEFQVWRSVGSQGFSRLREGSSSFRKKGAKKKKKNIPRFVDFRRIESKVGLHFKISVPEQ